MKIDRRLAAALLVFAGTMLPAPEASAVFANVDGAPPGSWEPSESRTTEDAFAKSFGVGAGSAPEWLDYRQSIVHALSTGATPRDRALAAVAGATYYGPESRANGQRALLADGLAAAATDAPHDHLVQWLALTLAKPDQGTMRAAARSRLQRAEADNGAVWLESLDTAARAGDDAAVAAALASMAASRTFDGHFADLVQALLAAYREQPLPASLYAPWEDGERDAADLFRRAMAVSDANVVAIPGFQELLDACRVNPDTGAHAERAEDCAKTGRLLVAHGDTLLANRIGSSLLRVARAFTDDDVAAARNVDWVFMRYQEAGLATGVHPDLRERRYVDDWIESGREIDAMRRALAREGIAETPPADWDALDPPFSAERQRADERHFAQHAPAGAR